jgi:hypothetical protein
MNSLPGAGKRVGPCQGGIDVGRAQHLAAVAQPLLEQLLVHGPLLPDAEPQLPPAALTVDQTTAPQSL